MLTTALTKCTTITLMKVFDCFALSLTMGPAKTEFASKGLFQNSNLEHFLNRISHVLCITPQYFSKSTLTIDSVTSDADEKFPTIVEHTHSRINFFYEILTSKRPISDL